MEINTQNFPKLSEDPHTQGDKAQQLLLIYIHTHHNKPVNNILTRNVEEHLTKCDSVNPSTRSDPLRIHS